MTRSAWSALRVPGSMIGLALLLASASTLSAQYEAGRNYSPNMKVMSHIPLWSEGSVWDIEMEQELSRPYVYVSRSPESREVGPYAAKPGFDIISLKDPQRGFLLYSWVIENPELYQGRFSNGKYFKVKDRYYYVQATQIRGGSPSRGLAAIVFDVTGLPDTTKIKEVGRIKNMDAPGGAHNLFIYKHSDGRVILFLTMVAPASNPFGGMFYDMGKFVSGDSGYVIGGLPFPQPRGGRTSLESADGYHDGYASYDPITKQDRFYAGGPEVSQLGATGYVWDISDPKNPKQLAAVIPNYSVQSGGHTFVASPDGRYAYTMMTSRSHQPMRVWDLKPALDGKEPVIQLPVGEWTAQPLKTGHMIELRWPYAFIADYEEGLRVVDVRRPDKPMEVGFYDTFNYPTEFTQGTAFGARGLDVRNADGLVVVLDAASGVWAIKMDGFDGWNGHRYGMPNASSVQDYDNGPDGAPKPQRVSVR